MTVLHYILILMIHFTKAQFPDHIDLQQIEQLTYKNEKYNILKPTVHKITDYYEEFMLRSESRTDEKIFIDNDGFRHFWTGMGLKPKSLRKTEISLYEINRNRQASSTSNEDVNTSKSSSEEGIKLPIPIPILRQVTKATATPKADAAKSNTAKPEASQAKPGKKKIAITTFFCPFLGVIRMTSVLD